jgi:hypothetical protein
MTILSRDIRSTVELAKVTRSDCRKFGWNLGVIVDMAQNMKEESIYLQKEIERLSK